MTDFRRVADDFFVAPQLRLDDFAAARANGIKTVINNRPDGEAADQLAESEARTAAAEAGLEYRFVPVVSGRMTMANIEDFRAAVDGSPGPWLAYCRSGTRSCHLWAFTAIRDTALAQVIRGAGDAGYDLGQLVVPLKQLSGEE